MGVSSGGTGPYLAVEIERRRLVPLISLDQGERSRSLRLTTLVDNQREARVRIFAVSPAGSELLREFVLADLPHQPRGEPRFTVCCDFDGVRRAALSVQAQGKTRKTTLDLGRFLPSARPTGSWFRPWMVLVLLLLLLVGAAGLLLMISRGSAPPPGSVTERLPQEAPSRTASPPPPSTDVAASVSEDDPSPGDASSPGDDTLRDLSVTPGPVPDAAPEKELHPEAGSPALVPLSREKTLYFLPDSPLITRAARSDLASFLAALRSFKDLVLTLEGHCALAGTETGREELSRRRAQAARDAILQEASWIEPEQISLSWYGSDRPVTRDPAEQDRNRRVEILAEGNIPGE